MYKIYADDTLIYDSTLEDYVITAGKISKEVNKSGSFTFTMYPDNPFYDQIHKLKTIITVYKRDNIIFRGRVLSEDIGFYNDKTFICEGELSFLLDSIQRPYDFTGTPAQLFTSFINSHNDQVGADKQFTVGQVTVTDPNDYIARSNTNYEDTLTNFNDHLLDTLGGYIHVSRGTNGEAVINWFSDFPYSSDQVIEFGENLLDFTRTNSGEEIATSIIPLGAEIGEGDNKERLTIESVNGGLDYIYNQTAVNTYGWITKVVTWDDVTVASNLLTKGRAYLAESINQNITIELTAVDLSLMDISIDSFSLGDYIRILSEPHNLDESMLLKKQTIDLLNPDNDEITLGYTYSSFTDTTYGNSSKANTVIKTVETIESNYVTNAVVTEEIENLKSIINQTSTSISAEVLAEYVSDEQLSGELSTFYEQVNDSFSFQFTQLTSSIAENDAENRRQFEELVKYIRFDNGDIILGEYGNEITVRIENDRISFLEGATEVAYFSNQKLYITDSEVLESLKIGNFAFMPRANGNLSFKKVGG